MPKIIIFEDDKFLADMYVTKFQMFGFAVKQFSQPPKNLVSVVAQEKPDIISMDILMPVMSGFEATEILKQDERTKHIPIVFLSNLSQQSDIDRGKALGAADYLVKANFLPSQVVARYCEIIGIPVPKEDVTNIPVAAPESIPQSTVTEPEPEISAQQPKKTNAVRVPLWVLMLLIVLSVIGIALVVILLGT